MQRNFATGSNSAQKERLGVMGEAQLLATNRVGACGCVVLASNHFRPLEGSLTTMRLLGDRSSTRNKLERPLGKEHLGQSIQTYIAWTTSMQIEYSQPLLLPSSSEFDRILKKRCIN